MKQKSFLLLWPQRRRTKRCSDCVMMQLGFLAFISVVLVVTVPYKLFEVQQRTVATSPRNGESVIQESLSTFKELPQPITSTTTVGSPKRYTRGRVTAETSSSIEMLTTAKHVIDEIYASPIRRWGCQRNETPLVFVHVGKSGGGMVRARFAAGAQSYDRGAWNRPEDDKHYYPISEDRKGKFCTSLNQHARAPYNGTLDVPYAFEGTVLCNATTPLGLAIACPQPTMRLCGGCQSFIKSDKCDTVYAGHNFIGSELHWLPPMYLQKWWEENWGTAISPTGSHGMSEIEWTRLESKKESIWCEGGYHYQNKIWYRRPMVGGMQTEETYLNCSAPLASRTDEQFRNFWASVRTDRSIREGNAKNNDENNFSPIYASLPLHRVTILREPWSWLSSKFYWNHLDGQSFTCESDVHIWAAPFILDYLLPLCGEDCANRFEHGMMTYEEIEVQVTSNLRQAFSVVGLLNETSDFYDMVSTRIGYMDMSLNPHVVGEVHQSADLNHTLNGPRRCKAIFETAKFQEKVRQEFPAVRILERVYNVAVEVNRFQREELNQCNA